MTTHAPLRSPWTKAESVYHVRVTGILSHLLVKIQGWKLFHAVLTFAVFSPSLLTFFNVVASLENGLVNASYNVNLIVHNTAWVPGHFHLTVGSAVTLTFMGISYWLIPFLRGRAPSMLCE